MPPAIEEITVEELAAWLAEDRPLILLDVREPWEHAIAALPNSTLVPLGELADADLFDEGRDDRARPSPTGGGAAAGAGAPAPVLVAYCHHGVRSLDAIAILRARGSSRPMVSLAGGIDAWSRRIDPGVPRY